MKSARRKKRGRANSELSVAQAMVERLSNLVSENDFISLMMTKEGKKDCLEVAQEFLGNDLVNIEKLILEDNSFNQNSSTSSGTGSNGGSNVSNSVSVSSDGGEWSGDKRTMFGKAVFKAFKEQHANLQAREQVDEDGMNNGIMETDIQTTEDGLNGHSNEVPV